MSKGLANWFETERKNWTWPRVKALLLALLIVVAAYFGPALYFYFFSEQGAPFRLATTYAAAPRQVPATDCAKTNAAGLAALTKTVAPGDMFATSQILPGGGQGDLVLIPRRKIDLSSNGTKVRLVIATPEVDPHTGQRLIFYRRPLRAEPLSDDESKQLQGQNSAEAALLQSADTALMLHTVVPDHDPWDRQFHFNLWEPTSYKVYVCSNATLVAWADSNVLVSGSGAATLAALALVALAYAFATLMVYFDRSRTAAASSRQVLPPRRLEPVNAWRMRECLNPIVLTSDLFDRGSLSKLQILIFTGCITYELAALLLRTGTLADLSPTIAFLLGIPAAGTIGVQLTAIARDRLSVDNWSWLVNQGVLPLNDPGQNPPRWRDLVMADSEMDLSKLQALVFTVIIAAAILISGTSAVSTFSVPTNLLEILGLSQAVFVGGRFTKSATMGDLDGLITQLRQRLSELRDAVATGIDVDSDGKPGPGPAKDGFPYTTWQQASVQLRVAARRYLDVADQVKTLLEAISHRSVKTSGLLTPVVTGP